MVPTIQMINLVASYDCPSLSCQMKVFIRARVKVCSNAPLKPEKNSNICQKQKPEHERMVFKSQTAHPIVCTPFEKAPSSKKSEIKLSNQNGIILFPERVMKSHSSQ